MTHQEEGRVKWMVGIEQFGSDFSWCLSNGIS
jgi:hypothetical protein